MATRILRPNIFLFLLLADKKNNRRRTICRKMEEKKRKDVQYLDFNNDRRMFDDMSTYIVGKEYHPICLSEMRYTIPNDSDYA